MSTPLTPPSDANNLPTFCPFKLKKVARPLYDAPPSLTDYFGVSVGVTITAVVIIAVVPSGKAV
jgi:hypothetical protein